MEEKKEPEIIVIEEKGEYEENTSFADEETYYRSFRSLKKDHTYPWITHVVFALASFVIAFLIVGLGFFIALLGIIDLCSLFQVESIHQRFLLTFKLWRKLFAFLLGTLVGIITPQFGIGILTTYLLLQGDKIQEEYLMRMVNR